MNPTQTLLLNLTRKRSQRSKHNYISSQANKTRTRKIIKERSDNIHLTGEPVCSTRSWQRNTQFIKKTTVKQRTWNQEPAYKNTFEIFSTPVLTAAHTTRTTHTTTHATTITKKTNPTTCKYHSIISQALALVHTTTDPVTHVSSCYSLPQIETCKTQPVISQERHANSSQGAMTPNRSTAEQPRPHTAPSYVARWLGPPHLQHPSSY